MRRRLRIRRKIFGDSQRPRLVVTFSGKHIYAQCVDDALGKTLVGVSTLKLQDAKPNREGSTRLGKILGERAKALGIEKVVFDRAAKLYHGNVKAFADAARGEGLVF